MRWVKKKIGVIGKNVVTGLVGVDVALNLVPRFLVNKDDSTSKTRKHNSNYTSN